MNSALNFFANWLRLHHSGKENSVYAKDMKQFGNAREIRFLVHELRTQGIPICSGNDGYYFAKNAQEVKQTLNFLESIEEDLSKAIKGLNDAYERIEKSS